jgi:D-beta-D-heptose 7-phosphate kinase/D-beta-D-heptose 1-phosphate adenosyltransferase
MSIVQKLLDSPSTFPITIVGEAMIDEYLQVDCKRISPEYPLPVYLSETAEPHCVVPGGGGNLAHQFKWIESVRLCCFSDPYCRKIFEKEGINFYGVDLPEGYAVPVKKRIYHGDYPLVRWDVEKTNYGLSNTQLTALQNDLFKCNFPENSVVVFSDYNKGMFVNMDEIPVSEECITIVDPKKGPLSKWRGCTIFKPNAKEAEELTGEKGWEKQARKIQDVLGCVAVVITQGSDGIAGVVGHRTFEYRPQNKVMAESTIGAGDCFLAWLAASQARGMDIIDGVEVAWLASAVYVQRKHNRPVHPVELMAHIDSVRGKIISPDWLKTHNFNLVFTNGCFDCLGAHHVKLLEFAKTKGSKLIVAVNSDASVRRIKGNSRPFCKLEDRMHILASLDCVDFVVSFDEDTPHNLIKLLNPSCIVKGGDYMPENVAGSDVVGKENVVIFPTIHGYSTTNLIDNIKRSI